jgi:predicted dehydrogenase
MTLINIAIVGYGYWGPNILRNFNEADDARVVLCCDVNPKRLELVKSKYHSVEVSENFEDVITDNKVDAVAIVTPVATHYEFARKALEHGKHVLVEKPLAASVAEAESLVNIADRQNLTLMVNHTFIYTGAVRKMKEIVESGVLGDMYYFDSVRINLGLIQKDVNVLWDLAPHDISILGHLVEEEPNSVCATGTCHFGNGIESVAYLTVYFNSGVIAHFHNNWLAPVKIRSIIVGGSKKMILYDDMEASEKIKVYDKGVDVNGPESEHERLISYRLGDMWAPKIDNTEALRLVAAEFIESIQSGRPPITDGASGLNVVKILEASEMSIKHKGREVKL